MNHELLVVLSLLVATIVMLALNKPRGDVVALLMIVALPLTGVVTTSEALSGFGNPNVVLIAAMFVIGEGLARTGVAQRLGDWLAVRGGGSELRLLVLLMGMVGLMGSVMSSTGVVAIFIPVVLRIAAKTGAGAGRLLLPMAYAALISGMLTLVATSSNLVINYELVSHGKDGFEFFDFTLFGLSVLALGILFMSVARRWLPSGDADQPDGRVRPRIHEWVERYQLAEREERVRVRLRSPLVGKTLDEVDLYTDTGARVIAVQRRSRFGVRILRPLPTLELRVNDILLLDRCQATLDRHVLHERYGLKSMPLSGSYFADRSQDVGMAEVVVPAESRLIGQTIAELQLRTQYELHVVGLRRRNKIHPPGFAQKRLKAGDTLLLVGPWRGLRRLQADGRDLVVLSLPAESEDAVPAVNRGPQALFALSVTVVLMVTGIVPNVQAGLIGCLLMGLFRCISVEAAYRAISWKNLILIVGILPFTLALERTGAVDIAANALIGVVGNAEPRFILASLFAITIVLGLVIVNTANALLITPLALAIAEDLGASPYPFAMTVALAASAAFMTPISPVNALVATAGNYRFGDFIRMGLPFTLLTLAVAVLLVPVILPFY